MAAFTTVLLLVCGLLGHASALRAEGSRRLAAAQEPEAYIPQNLPLPPLPAPGAGDPAIPDLTNDSFPELHPEVYRKAPPVIHRLENKNFTHGVLYTLLEKVKVYRELVANITIEVHNLTDALKYHRSRLPNTKHWVKRAVERVRRLNYRLHLLKLTAASLEDELAIAQQGLARANNRSATYREDTFHDELKNFGRTPVDMEKMRISVVVQKAAKQVAKGYSRLYKLLVSLNERNGTSFRLDDAPLEDFLDAVQDLDFQIRDLDTKVKDTVVGATKHLAAATAGRLRQIVAHNDVLRLRKDVKDYGIKIKKATALYLNAKEAFDKIDTADVTPA